MLFNASTRCRFYCNSCKMLHHCHGEYEQCPYGRSSEDSENETDINNTTGTTDITEADKN